METAEKIAGTVTHSHLALIVEEVALEDQDHMEREEVGVKVVKGAEDVVLAPLLEEELVVGNHLHSNSHSITNSHLQI